MIVSGFKKSVLDYGYVTYLDHIGTDAYLAETARVSTDSKGKSVNLISRLVKDKHTSPLEFAVIQFEIKAPLFVFREWHRHRTFSYSERSARFADLPDDYYVPSLERMNPQHDTNKQMSDEAKILDNASSTLESFRNISFSLVSSVNWFRRTFILTRELSQRLYPQTRYTICRASGNLWNWMHFLNLRCREDAQYEIRQYANAIRSILKELFPVAMEAWEEYIFYGITLSKTEKELLKLYLNDSTGLLMVLDPNNTSESAIKDREVFNKLMGKLRA